jgi:D-3-phosphoglycerate dehydrogenase
MILLIRRAAALSYKLHQGQWHKSSTNAFEIRGKTLGIIGYGNIGAQLSVVAEGLGMRVVFYDIDEKLPLGNAKKCISQQEVLIQSDIITLHVDGRKENTNLIGRDEFASMKDGVVFLNLSRGHVVDMDGLLDALKSGKVGGTALDVYPEEPAMRISEFKHPIQAFDNVILTPHIGGSTEEAQEDIGQFVSKNLHGYCYFGNTAGSVNLPSIHLPSLAHQQRIIHMHENVPGVLAKINAIFAASSSNIEGQYLKTNSQIGYVITDIDKPLSEDDYNALQGIPNTIKVRKLAV